MIKFEVGKIYRNRDGDGYLRVTKRTETRIYSEFITLEKHTYDLDFKYRKIDVWNDCEHIHFPIGLCGELYSAENLVTEEEFNTLCENCKKKQEEAKAESEARIESQAKQFSAFLKEKGISLDLAMEIAEFISNISYEAIERVRKELSEE